jgi:hypothetical protein
MLKYRAKLVEKHFFWNFVFQGQSKDDNFSYISLFKVLATKITLCFPIKPLHAPEISELSKEKKLHFVFSQLLATN